LFPAVCFPWGDFPAGLAVILKKNNPIFAALKSGDKNRLDAYPNHIRMTNIEKHFGSVIGA